MSMNQFVPYSHTPQPHPQGQSQTYYNQDGRATIASQNGRPPSSSYPVYSQTVYMQTQTHAHPQHPGGYMNVMGTQYPGYASNVEGHTQMASGNVSVRAAQAPTNTIAPSNSSTQYSSVSREPSYLTHPSEASTSHACRVYGLQRGALRRTPSKPVSSTITTHTQAPPPVASVATTNTTAHRPAGRQDDSNTSRRSSRQTLGENTSGDEHNNVVSDLQVELQQQWGEAKNRIQGIKQLIYKLEKAIEHDFTAAVDYSRGVDEARRAYMSVSDLCKVASEHVTHREEYLEDTERRYKLLAAQQLEHCSNNDLDEVSDMLSAGLNAVLVALSKRGDQSDEVAESTPAIEFFHKRLSDTTPPPPSKPTMGEFAGQAVELCSSLIETLQELRRTQDQCIDEIKKKASDLAQLQTAIITTDNKYKTQLLRLQSIEERLNQRLKMVNRLSGKGDYSDQTKEQLKELCTKIPKADKKIALERAKRTILAEGADTVLKEAQTDRRQCIVCFERQWDTTLEPCGHFLCEDCAARLNYCPQCRKEIRGKLKCIQP